MATIGAALGLLFAKWGSALLVQQLGTWESTVSLDLALDWRVLVFTATLACLCAMSAGVAPMFALKSVAPGEALKSAGRAMAGDRRFALRGALVVAQIAVSFVLVVAAGLFLRTFASLNQLPLGFVPEPLVVVDVNLFASGIPPEERGARLERLRNAAAVSGVRSVSVSQMTAADRRRMVHQQHGGRGRWPDASGGPPKARLAKRHHARLVRDDGYPAARRAGLQ